MESAEGTPNIATDSAARRCQSIDWYAEGEGRTVLVDGIEVTVRFVGRKGRRARISIAAPPGAVFEAGDLGRSK